MTDPKELPGITFHLEQMEEQGSFNGKLTVRFTITAIADDEKLVDKVRKKFEGGFRIHTVEDFKGVLLNNLREETKELERKITDLEFALHGEQAGRRLAEHALQTLRDSLSFRKKSEG